MPVPLGPKGGLTITSIIFNTVDSSTSTGFNDFSDGTTWNTEADLQYRLGSLPGGMNLGVLYSFNQDFAKINSRSVYRSGPELILPKEDSTWAVYWSAWQYIYIYAKDPGDKPVNLANGEPDLQGLGLFTRVGFADKETNPVDWAVSGGIGGRGMIPTRDDDFFGVGYFYTDIQSTELISSLGARSNGQGFEAFYNIAATPAFHVTLDLQVVEPVGSSVSTATILGMRASMVF